MIKPTVGRMLHYYPASEDGGAIISFGQPLAATIAHVWNDRCINIAYLDTNGVWRGKTSVLLVHENDEARPGAGYCVWMPYQKGQAAKTDSLERKLLESANHGVAGLNVRARHDALDSLLAARIPILDQIYDLCQAIEKCGASPELTDAVTKASALREPISELVRQALLLGIGDGIVRVSYSSNAPTHCDRCLRPVAHCDGHEDQAEPPEHGVTGDSASRQPSPATGDVTVTSRDVPCDAIEQEIQSKGLTAPRVTPADIEASIAGEHYFTAADGVLGAYRAGGDVHPVGGTPNQEAHAALGLLTHCVLVLRNGFTVTGESACASPENFDEEIGRRIARQNALQKVWPLAGHLLRERLHNAPAVAGAVALLTASAKCCDTNAAARDDLAQAEQDRVNAASYRLAANLLQA